MFTLILPHFLRPSDARLPELSTPIWDELCRFARFQAAPMSRFELYQRHLCVPLRLPENSVYASPIHHQIGMNHVMVQHGSSLKIRADEAQTWCRDLNQLYGDEAHFTPIRADLWRVDLPEAVNWCAEPILDLSSHLQAQEMDAWYLQLSSETQMYLHQHALNIQRYPCSINGLYFWQAPESAKSCTHRAIATNSDWQAQSACPSVALPQNWADWQQYCQSQNLDLSETAWFDERFLWAEDEWHYAEILAQWDTEVATALQTALQSGSLKNVKVVMEQGELILSAPRAWAFWRRKKGFDGKGF